MNCKLVQMLASRLRIIAMLFLTMAFSVPAISAGPQDVLKLFAGKWKAMLSFAQAGGQFTVSLAEQAQVKQLDQNTISFSMKPVTAAQPVFNTTLRYDTATKKYLLSVKTDSGGMLEKVVLDYEENTGFSGKGMLKSGEKAHPVEVKIKLTAGGHEWSVTDPNAPPKNNTVLSFTFFKRED